ncbi:MAG TPA: TonB-dependent receptor [Rhizomicrobium sp.]|jgi:TonB-dependent receptor|nr:TonB-dependent receptor [Rhizomicrobium sp.]
MHPVKTRFIRNKTIFLSTSMLVSAALFAPAHAQQVAAASTVPETVTVTGYAESLELATDAKRNSTGFTDTIFAEDIGKFPDTDIAESLNRIPGVTISREIDGEGLNVSIRGLGTNFTRVTLNGAAISIASTGATDQSDNDREIDLNMLPTELFTQLTVSKSVNADLLEGGAAGVVNLRSARPFDYKDEGFHITYEAQGSDYSNANTLGERGALIARDTWGDKFGVLVGLAGVHSEVFTKGWEDGNAGWVTPGALSAAQCGAGNTCDSIGGNAWAIPATVPAGVTTGGLVPGQAIDAAELQHLNPGLTTAQISNALVPRLGRTMYERGSRDRYNGILSLEWRPTQDLHFYLDGIFGRTFNALDRSDIDWGVRAGAGSQPLIPENLTLDPNGVVTGGTFANSQFFLEARPYQEKGDFFSLNPGASWQINDLMHLDVQANASRSHFFRDSPTILVVSCPSSGNPAGTPGCTAPAGGVYATFTNAGQLTPPTITTNIDLNNPANFQWNNGRVNLQDEKRYEFTQGAHADYTWGGDLIALKAGAAYDDIYRNITAIDASNIWSDAACGDNPSNALAPPNSMPACRGLNVAGTAATVNAVSAGAAPAYAGYGTGYTAGATPITYGGSLIPQSALANYLIPGPTGFITANYPAFKAASNYNAIDQAAINAVGNALPGTTGTYPYSTASNVGGNSGTVEEKDYGLYLETEGKVPVYDHNLRYNVGLRWVETHQYITSPVANINPANATLLDGGQYPTVYSFSTAKHDYADFLPAANMVYEVSDDFQVRLALSRTMTRPNPNQMISGVNFSDLTAQNATLGNPNLKPFFSNNIDIGAEYYTGGAGYIGVTAFRKSLSGFTAQSNITEPFSYLAQFGVTYAGLNATQQTALNNRGCTSDTNCTATILVTEQVNQAGLLVVNGLEFDYTQPLDFLLADYGLPGFGFTGNTTILDQHSTGIAPAFATGIPPLAYNLTGYYDHNGASVRVSYVWNDRTYSSGSNTQSVCLPSTAAQATGCPAGAYLFSAPYGQMDISSSYRLANIFGDLPTDPELTFDVQNVLSGKLKVYDQYTNAIHSYYNQGKVFLFGFRGTF